MPKTQSKLKVVEAQQPERLSDQQFQQAKQVVEVHGGPRLYLTCEGGKGLHFKAPTHHLLARNKGCPDTTAIVGTGWVSEDGVITLDLHGFDENGSFDYDLVPVVVNNATD